VLSSQGIDEGAVSSRILLEHGDFGLGTFAGGDGEMVVVDGSIYQACGDGSVKRRQDEFRTPLQW
jgi:acetolactate decarboxylase